MRVKQGNRLTPRLATVDIFFLHSQCEMLKTQCALHSSTLECIWRISFCTAWPIQNQENGIWRKRNDHFLTTLGKKFGHACWSKKEIPCPNGLEASFLNSATSTREVLQRWNEWWGHYASTGSFTPASSNSRWFLYGICLLGKSDWLPFFQYFPMWGQVAGSLRPQSGC